MPDVEVAAELRIEQADATKRTLRAGDSAGDFGVDRTGAAKEVTLAALLMELAEKVEPAHLASLATEATMAKRYAGGKTPVVASVTAAGDTTIHTPALGKRIRLYWLSALNDPDAASTPLINVRLGALEVYRTYAIAHWEVFDGAVDAPLVVNLSEAGSIAVTAHLVEI